MASYWGNCPIKCDDADKKKSDVSNEDVVGDVDIVRYFDATVLVVVLFINFPSGIKEGGKLLDFEAVPFDSLEDSRDFVLI